MDRPNLQGRVPDGITARLPGGESATDGTATDEPDDGGDGATDGSDSRRWTTLLTLAGLGLAALGVGLRYALDRRGDGGTDDEDDGDRPPLDRDDAGTVEIVGDTGATDDTSDGTATAGASDERERGGDERDDATDTESDVSAPEAVTGTETDVAVETFAADRTGDKADTATRADDAATDREGPPRIAPLVGMVALVGIRLFTERVRKRFADAPGGAADGPAGQL